MMESTASRVDEERRPHALDQNQPAAIAAIPPMDKTATDDFQEGIASFVERRPAEFTGR